MTRLSSRVIKVLMTSLGDRQTKILRAIVEEYIETAQPVGSETVEKKYGLGVSPATIRSEMVRLTERGFLQKSHSSSGRSPTPLALKYYVSHLMKEEGLSLAEEVSVKEKVWDYRHELDKLLRQMTRELAFRTREIALASTEEGDIYTAGMANILDDPEFFDIDVTKALLSHLDEAEFWLSLTARAAEEEALGVLLGSDLGHDLFEPCGFVYRRFEVGDKKGVLGVIGPARLNFSRVFPTVRYFGDLIDEVVKNW